MKYFLGFKKIIPKKMFTWIFWKMIWNDKLKKKMTEMFFFYFLFQVKKIPKTFKRNRGAPDSCLILLVMITCWWLNFHIEFMIIKVIILFQNIEFESQTYTRCSNRAKSSLDQWEQACGVEKIVDFSNSYTVSILSFYNKISN